MSHIAGRSRRVASLITLAGGALALLSACTEIKQGQSPVYDDAYKDGCDSGYTQAFGSITPRAADKDERQYTADVNYRRGWYDGYRQCYADAMRIIQSRSGGGGR